MGIELGLVNSKKAACIVACFFWDLGMKLEYCRFFFYYFSLLPQARGLFRDPIWEHFVELYGKVEWFFWL